MYSWVNKFKKIDVDEEKEYFANNSEKRTTCPFLNV
jgi:hypothetical protein